MACKDFELIDKMKAFLLQLEYTVDRVNMQPS
jgi:hypothetical protein